MKLLFKDEKEFKDFCFDDSGKCPEDFGFTNMDNNGDGCRVAIDCEKCWKNCGADIYFENHSDGKIPTVHETTIKSTLLTGTVTQCVSNIEPVNPCKDCGAGWGTIGDDCTNHCEKFKEYKVPKRTIGITTGMSLDKNKTRLINICRVVRTLRADNLEVPDKYNKEIADLAYEIFEKL